MTIKQPEATQIPALRALWKEAFEDEDAFLDAFWQSTFRADRCRCVTVEHTLVAALYWFDCEFRGNRIAYIYAVATAKAHQGKGVCRVLMNDTHDHLTALGYQGAVLVPGSDALFSLYRKMGYDNCGQIREFACTAAEEPIQLQPIDEMQYGVLRRQMLPEDAVIQEKENLIFLRTQAQLYAGTDFLLAAQREGETLRGIELLGNEVVAPKILRALGYEHGVFRMPGAGRPFAMYHDLGKGDWPAPKYFGLAFD